MRCVEKFSKTCAIRATSAIVQDYQGFSLEKGASVSVHPGSVGTRWRGRTDYVNRMDGKIQLL